MKKTLMVIPLILIGCGQQREGYEEMRKREEAMWHQPLPKPLEQIKIDIYGLSLPTTKCCKLWVFKQTDDNKMEVEACRRINNYYWVYIDVECSKPHLKNTRLKGRIKVEYTTEGKFVRVTNCTAEVLESLE